MEPVTPESASHQLSGVEKYAAGFSRQQRRELQNQFETGLQWLEQNPPAYEQALKCFAHCMKTDPMAAVYTYEFLQTLDTGYEKGHYRHGWRQRRRNAKLVKRIAGLANNQQWDSILQRAPEALYHNARHERLLRELAFAAQAIGAAETQWTYLEFALKYFSGSADVHVQIIHAFYQSGRFDDANDHMFQLVKTANNSLLKKVLQSLPGIITQQFPGQESIHKIEAIRKTIEQNPSKQQHWLELCEVLKDLNLYGQAIDACHQALQTLGNSSDWTQRMLDLRLLQAETRLSFHTQLESSEELILDLQHEVWRIRTEYFQKLSAQHPALLLPAVQLGWCLLGTKNWYEAIKLFEEYRPTQLTNAPENLALLLGLAEAQQAVRRFEDALSIFSVLLEALDSNELQNQELDRCLEDQIPGLEGQSFYERSLNRIKTLAEAMNADQILEKCRRLAQKSTVSTDN
ncbi:MAG: hypothetical protein CMJ82_06655 [Planctomycetaceae bacterium]|nr:hypothetical protein [Planctomycetaceae bacterium]